MNVKERDYGLDEGMGGTVLFIYLSIYRFR